MGPFSMNFLLNSCNNLDVDPLKHYCSRYFDDLQKYSNMCHWFYDTPVFAGSGVAIPKIRGLLRLHKTSTFCIIATWRKGESCDHMGVTTILTFFFEDLSIDPLQWHLDFWLEIKGGGSWCCCLTLTWRRKP